MRPSRAIFNFPAVFAEAVLPQPPPSRAFRHFTSSATAVETAKRSRFLASQRRERCRRPTVLCKHSTVFARSGASAMHCATDTPSRRQNILCEHCANTVLRTERSEGEGYAVASPEHTVRTQYCAPSEARARARVTPSPRQNILCEHSAHTVRFLRERQSGLRPRSVPLFDRDRSATLRIQRCKRGVIRGRRDETFAGATRHSPVRRRAMLEAIGLSVCRV